jgi:hypothetical protein
MNEELYILFENYLNNELSEKEKIDFENQLQNDASIREKLSIYKELNGFLDTKFSSESLDFKKNLETISKSNFTANKKSETKVISFKPYFYAIAAVFVLSFGILFFNQSQNPEYSNYNQHETPTFSDRGDIIKNLMLAQKAFNVKDYQTAATNFEIVLKDYNRPEVAYFYGISLLELDKFAESEVIFDNLKSGKSIYREKATWYLALSNLKQKKYNETKELLKQIPEDAEDYAKAEKLLDELD